MSLHSGMKACAYAAAGLMAAGVGWAQDASGSIAAWDINVIGVDLSADVVALAVGAHDGRGIKGDPRPYLDIMPGSCPNSFDRMMPGVLVAALLGSDELNVQEIDLGTVQLSRRDEVGRSAAPLWGQLGSHSMYQDVAKPVEGETCGCHVPEPDGFVDLLMTFKKDEVVGNLLLNDLDVGALVELMVTGNLRDGTPFEASDCILLVPPGTQAGVVAVGSNVPGVWIDADPLDLQFDGGGVSDFERSYPVGTVVTLTAESSYQGRRFVGWRLDGQFQSAEQWIDLTVTAERHTVEAILLWPGDMDGDEHVDLLDFATFGMCFRDRADDPTKCPAESRAASDLDTDGDVDLADFATFAVNFTG